MADGEKRCGHCHKLYNPRLNFGSWGCRRHLQAYDSGRDLYPCCGVLGSQARIRRLEGREQIEHPSGTVYLPGLPPTTAGDWLGCCRADHDLPPIEATRIWPPYQPIPVYLLRARGAHAQAINWANVLRTHADYVAFARVAPADVPSVADFEHNELQPAAMRMVRDPAFYTYMAENLPAIRAAPAGVTNLELRAMASFDSHAVASLLFETLNTMLERHNARDIYVTDTMRGQRLTLRQLSIRIVNLLPDYARTPVAADYWQQMAGLITLVQAVAALGNIAPMNSAAANAGFTAFAMAMLVPAMPRIPSVPVMRASATQDPLTVLRGFDRAAAERRFPAETY